MTSWTRVRTHDKNSGETVRRLGTIIQSIFVPNQEPAFAWPLEMVRWESVPKVSSARAWKLSSGLFSWPDWLPLGVRGCASRWFTSNQMVPNAKKTKPLLIATRQKLQHVNQPTLDLFLTGNRLEEPRMKIPGRQDGQSPYLAQPYRILNWETELKKLFT